MTRMELPPDLSLSDSAAVKGDVHTEQANVRMPQITLAPMGLQRLPTMDVFNILEANSNHMTNVSFRAHFA
jgi:hypothetical protein